MEAPWDLVVSTLAAVVATLAGVFAGTLLTNRSQKLHWSRSTRLDACAELLRQFAVVYDGLAGACVPGGNLQVDWTRWSQALTVLSLTETQGVVDAALVLDEAIWRAAGQVKDGTARFDQWLELRKPLESARLAFVNTARRELDIQHRDLSKVIGRPAPQ